MPSSCLAAWLKYRPSVARAAASSATTAVPAEPENPEMYSFKSSVGKHLGGIVYGYRRTSPGIGRSYVFGLVTIFGGNNCHCQSAVCDLYDSMALLKISTLFRFINSLNCMRRSVVSTLSMLTTDLRTADV